MGEPRAPDLPTLDPRYSPGKGLRLTKAGDGGEGNSLSTTRKCRKLDRGGIRAAIDTEHNSRFLFVDSSSGGQRPRSTQRAINAHIQQTAQRNRRRALAHRERGTGATTTGRNRREPELRPRPVEPSLPSATLIDHGALEASRISLLSASGASSSPDVYQGVVSRLRHYSTVRAPEVRSAINAQREDDLRAASALSPRGAPGNDGSLVEDASLRSLLTRILQRLDAGNVGHAIQGQPVSSLKNTILDPFNVSAVIITPSMNTTLRHFSDVMIPSVFPTRQQAAIQIQWAFEKAARKPIVLYSLLAVSSAERSARLGALRSGSQETTFTEEDIRTRQVPDFVSYKVNAVKLANDIMKSMDRAAKASTIFAMMCLLSIEVITGNHKEILAHVGGLQKLIAWRGGYHGIPPHATELILSTSYMCAAMTRSLPSAPPTSSLAALSPDLIEQIQRNLTADVEQMGTGILNPQVDAMLAWTISQAFRDMRDVVQYREYYHEKQLHPVEAELDYINAKSYQFRYAVLSAPFQPGLPASDKEEACRLALLIFWFCNYQMSQPDSALNRTLTNQLKGALQASDLRGLWGPNLELLAWVLLLGAFISAGQRERPWFVLNLARLSRVLKFKEWVDVRALLSRFFYLDRVYAKEMQNSWDEATLLAETLEAGLS